MKNEIIPLTKTISTHKNILMNNNLKIPLIGLGTSGIKDLETMEIVISNAYKAGYRMIDTAVVYNNENLIGEVIEKLQILQDDLFIITKIPSDIKSIDDVSDLIKKSLSKLKRNSIDCVLLHWPGFKDVQERIDVWRVLESFVKSGQIKTIGVSNFRKIHLDTILNNCEIKPSVNQIELHPLYVDHETINYCREKEIVVIAYTPFAKFNEKLIDSDVIKNLCLKYQKKPTQILMRWMVQNNFVAIPKSSKSERIYENVNIDDFDLNEDEIKSIFNLNCDQKIIAKWDPKNVLF